VIKNPNKKSAMSNASRREILIWRNKFIIVKYGLFTELSNNKPSIGMIFVTINVYLMRQMTLLTVWLLR
jgi:hypothetical protein